ncbi:MAG: hypothetical protein AB2707_04150 [Candidatus Thiodiazotropha sp.]
MSSPTELQSRTCIAGFIVFHEYTSRESGDAQDKEDRCRGFPHGVVQCVGIFVLQRDREDAGDEKDAAGDIGDDLQVFYLDPGRALDTATDGFKFVGQERRRGHEPKAEAHPQGF